MTTDRISSDPRYVNSKTGERISAKATLAVYWNSWLHPQEMERAKKMAADQSVTEEQAMAELRRLEEEIAGRIELWRMYQ